MSPETLSSPPEVDRRSLWAVRIATIISLSLIVLGILMESLVSPKALFTVIFRDVLRPAFFFYVVILMLIIRPRKSGLALAFGTGSVVFFLIVVEYPSHLGLDIGRYPDDYFRLVAMIQIFLVASAFTTYQTMQSDKHKLRTLAVGIVVPLIIFSLNMPGTHGPYPHMAANEANTLGHIRQINDCANAYSIERPDSGFPDSLALMGRLGGECNNERLVRVENSGYRITYVPGAPDVNGAIKTYTISTRPLEYYQTGRRSYFSDESGVIRKTAEDRAASPKDPSYDTF